MVGAHLSTVDPVHLAHAFLDEGVTGFRLDGHAAARLDQLDGIPGETWIVHHPAAGMAAQQNLRQQPHEVVSLDKAALLVEEEAAIKVAVPGEPQVRAVPADRSGGGSAILLEHGIWDAIRKMTVRLVVDLDEREWQMRFQRVDDQARA